MSTAAAKAATNGKVVEARNVSKVFKRDSFEVKALDDVWSLHVFECCR
jgi:hypothetical protein